MLLHTSLLILFTIEPSSGYSVQCVAAAAVEPQPEPSFVAGGYGLGEISPHHCLVVAAALVCIGALLLPTAGDPAPSYIPVQLHLSTQVKLAFAYGLGLLTVALLRPA